MFKQLKKLFSTDKKLAKRHPKVLQYEELEPRVLFSADYMPGLDNIAVDQQVVFQDIGGNYQVEREAAPETVEQKAAEERLELVIVNEDVADYKQLIADLQSSDDNRVIEVVVLESDRDGIEQVSEILAERSDVAAVHFISHGADGQINLGNSRLTSTTLEQNSDAVAGWGKALTESGDILFYGCNIAVDEDGQNLADTLAELTGADVAASDDVTGHASLGGDWELEYNTSLIETSVAISTQTQQDWNSALAVNQAPVNTVPDDQTTAQDTSLVFDSGNLISISDADAGSNEVKVTLEVTNGTLTLGSIGGAVGGETLVNTETANYQIRPDMAFAADGSYVVVWTSSGGQDGELAGVYMQRFDANGVASGGETPVNTETASNQQNAAIAMDDAGNFVVVWESMSQDKQNTLGVYGQRFDFNGDAVGVEFLVNETTGGTQRQPDVAMTPNGAFVVVWTGPGGGSDTGILFRRYDNTGAPLSGETFASPSGTGEFEPAIAMDDAGNFVLVWEAIAPDSTYGVFAARFDSNGNALGGEFEVNTTKSGVQDSAAVAMDSDGDFVIAWSGHGIGDVDISGVFVQRYNAVGTAQGDETLVNTMTTDYQRDPSVAMNAAGEFVVAWISYLQDGSLYGIYAQQFDAAGATQGSEFLVNTTTANGQATPSVVMHDGGFAVVWDGNGDQTGQVDTSGVFMQRYENSPLTFTVGDGADDSTMTFTGTVADINTALEGLTYTPNAGYNGVDTLTITTDDQGNTGTGGALQDVDTVNITVDNPNAAVIDLNGGDGASNDFAATWTEDGGVVAVVDSDSTLIDSDENLTSLTVTITDLLDVAAESLSANPGATGLSVNYVAATGVLTISGAGTAAQYQQVLRTVTYNNTSDTPDTTARIITFTATDAISNGNTATTTLTVQATNDAPVNSMPGNQTTAQDTSFVFTINNGT